MVRNVYEGTIPDKYFKISVFFTDELQQLKMIFYLRIFLMSLEKLKWHIIKIMNNTDFSTNCSFKRSRNWNLFNMTIQIILILKLKKLN